MARRIQGLGSLQPWPRNWNSIIPNTVTACRWWVKVAKSLTGLHKANDARAWFVLLSSVTTRYIDLCIHLYNFGKAIINERIYLGNCLASSLQMSRKNYRLCYHFDSLYFFQQLQSLTCKNNDLSLRNRTWNSVSDFRRLRHQFHMLHRFLNKV